MTAWIGAALLLFFSILRDWTGFVAAGELADMPHLSLPGWERFVPCSLMAAAVIRLIGGQDFDVALWTLNGWGPLSLHLDALSAIFLFTAGLVYLSCSFFAPDYLLHYFRNRYPAATLRRASLCAHGGRRSGPDRG